MHTCTLGKAYGLRWLFAGSALFAVGCGDVDLTAMDQGDDVMESSALAATITTYEAESLARTASAVGSKVTTEAAASGGKYVEFNGTAATGAWIEFTLTNVAAGTYDLKYLYKSNTNRGVVQISIDGVTQASCNEYAATATQKVTCNLGRKSLTAGNHKIRFTVTGKVASSSGYQVVVDQLSLTPVAGGAVPSAGCGKTPTLATGNGQVMMINGTNRSFNLKVPVAYDKNRPYRLMVAYHWLNGSATNVSSGSGTIKPWYGLAELAQESTIFVAPQGINNAWANAGGNDVEFSKQLIQRLAGDLCVDSSRIFSEGFSMGGSMSYALACALGGTVRAVAVHSGGSMSGCVSHTTPVAYFMTHGTRDAVTTYPGFGIPQLQDFAKVDGCKSPDPTLSAANFVSALPKPTSTDGACVEFTGCQAGYPVRSCLFVGDHTPTPGGSTSWVPAETWKFLSKI